MDRELDIWISDVIDNQKYRSGIFTSKISRSFLHGLIFSSSVKDKNS
ncbi:MAG: hypothetical protein ACKVIR_07280 [Candidatus Poseidoniales archaeon]